MQSISNRGTGERAGGREAADAQPALAEAAQGVEPIHGASGVLHAQGVSGAQEIQAARVSEPDQAYSIDELALAAGLPSRTVRHYQSAGALPPPRREGRAAVYGPAHLERLRLIGRLQDRGLTLDAIRDALRQVERGHLSLEAWLGLGEQVRTPWSADGPLLLTNAELEHTFGNLVPGLFAALMRLGLITRPDVAPASTSSPGLGSYLIPSPGLLRVALALRAAGIDVETSTGAIEQLRKHQKRAADDLVAYLLRRTGKGFARKGTPQDVAEAVGALRGHAVQAADLLFAQEMERAVRAAFDQGKPRLARANSATANQ